eukprot:133789-Pleurochrysis_carterae.AAC.2
MSNAMVARPISWNDAVLASPHPQAEERVSETAAALACALQDFGDHASSQQEVESRIVAAEKAANDAAAQNKALEAA